MSGVDEDEERRRQRRLEEALEVKSLRRIISAYLNYPDAAEEDVNRYERSFKKLPPAHKAFEPPLDMSQELDICENPHSEDVLNDHVSGAGDCCQSPVSSGRMSFSKSNQACCMEESNVISNSPKGVTTNKVLEHFIIALGF